MLSWFCSSLPPRRVFPIFIPEAHQEMLKGLGHGDVKPLHVKQGKAELQMNALYYVSQLSQTEGSAVEFPMLLLIWEAEPEGTLEAAGHMQENRKDSVTLSSLLSVRKKEPCRHRKRYFL